MATEDDRDKMWLASFNSQTPKTPCWTQRYPSYLVHKTTHSRFCPKCRCHGNGGWSR